MNIFSRYPALRHRDYRLMITGQFLSQSGSQMRIVAINWQIYLMTHSAVALGMMGLARFIPIIVFSLIGGSVADNFNRKNIQIFCQSLMTVCSFILLVTTWKGIINPAIIYAVTAFSASLFPFDLPARQAMTPSLVSKESFQNAMSLNSIQFHTATIFGPVIAGILIGRTGLASVYLIDVVSYIVFITLLFKINSAGKPANKNSEVSVAHIIEGIKFIRSRTIVWSTMLLDAFSTFFASAKALLPIFAKDILHVGAAGLGPLYSATALGAVSAGVVITHIGGIKNQGKIILISVFVYGLGTILFGISKIYLLTLVALIIVGFGDGISVVIRNTVRQMATPDHLRGRMTAVNMIFFMGGPELGEFEAGIVAGIIGAPLSVVTGGVATLAVVAIMTWRLPDLRNYKSEITPADIV